MATGIQTVKGSVTVDAESKTKRDISYPAFVVDDDKYPEFADLADTLLKQGVLENVNFTGEGDKRKKEGISLVELLMEGFKRYNYTVAVAKEKERFNNSPAKVESSLAKELKALAENPDATDAQRGRARQMLILLAN